MNSIRKPTAIVYKLLISWVSEYLTCEKMAAYVLSTANYHSEKIAFIDLDIDTRCDYLSVMTLIGLKQIIGKKVESLVKCDYIYEDYSGDTSALYGRGFGYTKILNPKLKDDENNIDMMNINELTEYSKTFQIIVINMRDRNIEIAKNLNVQGISARILYLWGSDTSMSKAKIKEIVNDFKGVHFCREIY